MNLYKALSDDYRSYQLRETEKLIKSKRLNSRVLKEAVKADKKTLKESVNVNVNSDDTNVSINVDGTQVTASVNSVPPVCEAPVEAVVDVVEEPVEEVVEEVPEDTDSVEPDEDSEELKENSDDIEAFWAKGFKPGDKVQSSGAGEVEIIDLNKDADYILVKRPTDSIEFVAAWAPEFDGEKISWGQGHYFDSEEDAREYFDSKTKGLEEADVVLKNPDKGDIEGQGYANALDKVANELFKGEFVKPELEFNQQGIAQVEYLFNTDLGTIPEDENYHLVLGVTDTYPGASNSPDGTKRYLWGAFSKLNGEDTKEDPDFVKEFDGSTPIAKLESLFKDIIIHDPMYKDAQTAIKNLDGMLKYRADNNIQDSEELQECEVRSFRITRISPSSGIYMIEADNSKNERSYIVGKNFNVKTNTLDEAEMFSDRSKANNKFKEMLVNSNRKGE